MEFGFTEEQEELRQEVRDFCEKGKPWGEPLNPKLDPTYSPECCRKVAEKGWIGLSLAKEYGGLGLDPITTRMAQAEMNYHMIPVGYIPYVTLSVLGTLLLKYGTEQQRREYLPKIIKGELLCAYSFTEPDAGVDLTLIKTSAVPDGDYYVINGNKLFATAVGVSQYLLVMARTGPKPKDLSLFLLDLKTPGITVNRIPTMAGYEAEEVFYDSVRVPKGNLVGELNRGFDQFEEIKHDYYWEKRPGELQGRLRGVLDALIQYAKETQYNGQPLSKNPLVRQKLAQMAIEIEVVDLIGYRFSWMQMKGLDTTRQSSLSKLGWNELYVKVASLGMQILGSYGTLRAGSKYAPLKGMIESIYGVSQLYHFIMDGVTIQRNLIAETLGLPQHK